jgi:hypothetical protein
MRTARELLSLSSAVRDKKLPEFINQEETRGVGSIYHAQFDDVIAALVKAPQSKDQTSRSPSRDGSTGKRTRQGNGRNISR